MDPQQIQLLDWYRELAAKDGWATIRAMPTLLEELFSKRDLSHLVCFTSHAAFCISKYEHPDRYDKPLLSINATAIDRISFELKIPLKSGPLIYRSISAFVNCPLQDAVAMFDTLLAEFEYANANPNKLPPSFQAD